MLVETMQLEALRQKIEDSEFEAGNQSDYLDRGKPNAAQAKRAQEMIRELNSQTEASKAELQQLIASVRSHQPQALEEWVNFHTGILQRIIEEKETGVMAATRRNVAKGTLQEWEKVRAGEQDFVRINWHYLKDYKESVRTLKSTSVSKIGGQSKVESKSKSDGKAWWQFWK